MMRDLNRRLDDKEISVELTEAAKDFIIEEAYDPIYGARPLRRFLQKTVETLSAKLILSGQIGIGDTIMMDLEEGRLTARLKGKKEAISE